MSSQPPSSPVPQRPRLASGVVMVSLALVVSTVACPRGRPDVSVKDSESPKAPDSVFVEVTNDHFYEARVHAIYDGGQRFSLGTIAGNGNHAQVAIGWQPRSIVFEINFVVGAGVYLSYPVEAAPGDVIEVRVPPNIEASGFFRRVSQ